MHSVDQISNVELTEGDIPPSSQDWDALVALANSFREYTSQIWNKENFRAVRFTRAWRTRFYEEGVLPATLTELRVCLFATSRETYWNDNGPNFGPFRHFHNNKWADALLDAIRQKVRMRELD